MTTFPRAERRAPSDVLLAAVDRLTVEVRGPSGPRILEDVGLTVRAGEFVAVVGPSGCGKSTLLRAVAGLLPPSLVAAEGSSVQVATDRGRRDVAWMPQRDGLLPWRRAWSNAMLGAQLAGRDVGFARTRAAELFERFGLAGCERRWPHELSGGMRRRLALVRTVLADRRLLLLDEPFSGLDALTRRRMNAWLRSVDLVGTGSRGGAVVLVTHDVDEAVLLADRVLVMAGPPGRVVECVPTDGADAEEARARLLALLGG
ncbi:ATP-binding cassette domain-containing protein [Actinotalea sp. M2MS4P-6]|uniref:ABC transporter ATP-binding protein n=1 Tax=Actinotalea sp. M2MS4P-6 TaxID=2983762 RepID=UPI0021E36CC7|nr:ATP-binding cassette domain-containing protein [Actinotalea sp. M2MS4P-6]MCV2393689.1 ATP-binding cassette domain-containing protein [Actinotalea sp. M2MS4P-6]